MTHALLVWTCLLGVIVCGGSASFRVARATAEHDVHYRFIVLGYVTDARDKPLNGTGVELIRDKTGFSYLAETDASGFYVIIARLGDESVGEALTLVVGSARTRITARFDPGNHQANRGTRVDMRSGTFMERAASFHATLAKFLQDQ